MHPQSEFSYTSTTLGPVAPACYFGRGLGSLLAEILTSC